MPGTDNPEALVKVALTGRSHDDAAAVFEALRAAFPSDRAASDVPQMETDGGRPTVWTAAYEVREAAQGEPAATTLTAPMTASVQGGYHAVDVLRGVLEGTFTVQEKGTAFGDQEKELELVLESR
ncbi:hypothetical protein AB0436_04670 [Streptomyces sp. NPDC051322]|uniref:hypothetical protein n=1 Tax=Streptomyces sp. NPDC051322 TaxID=3154645 RepID=UPI00344ED565